MSQFIKYIHGPSLRDVELAVNAFLEQHLSAEVQGGLWRVGTSFYQTVVYHASDSASELSRQQGAEGDKRDIYDSNTIDFLLARGERDAAIQQFGADHHLLQKKLQGVIRKR